MPYLNLDLDYFDHPKTVRLVGLLGRGADLLPIRLWCYCGKYHAETGELIGYSPEEIETAVKWWGQSGRALEALLRPFLERPGFLERIENGYKVHDWEEINGHIAALKERGRAGAKERWDRYRAAKAMLKHSSSNASANALSFPSLPSNKEEVGPAPQGVGGVPPGEKTKKTKEKKLYLPESIAYKAAKFFWSYVKEWAPEALEPTEAGYQNWATDLDLMFRKDKRTPKAFNELLEWIDATPERNGFSWRNNIHSPGKLRLRWREGKFVGFLPSELSRPELQ